MKNAVTTMRLHFLKVLRSVTAFELLLQNRFVTPKTVTKSVTAKSTDNQSLKPSVTNVTTVTAF